MRLKDLTEHLADKSDLKARTKYGPKTNKTIGEKKRKRQTAKKSHLDMSRKQIPTTLGNRAAQLSN